jgi:hypothetical protein
MRAFEVALRDLVDSATARTWLQDRQNWYAAILLGLISSTYSTLIGQFAAGRFGRDAVVDWMTVAAIPARDWVVHAEPSSLSVAMGIAFHQWADFSWALVFFGLFVRWTARLSPGAIALVAIPWAVLTSTLEWFILVPVFPFAQPIFTLQQPYWIGLLVHGSSAVVYPIFFWLRWSRRRIARVSGIFLPSWAAALVVTLAVCAGGSLAASHGVEIPWFGQDRISDQTLCVICAPIINRASNSRQWLRRAPKTRICARWRN